ncbi:MAG: B12-binding domain-containing radical SAM protein, partial [Desulfuromonadaceae bacterium]|nr:B12-binding domain-containing radical SAM protein [Desulfuromonadaceae bacterium]
MRSVLVFSPAASPTYVPLGLATLAASIQKNCSLHTIKLVDANLLVWQRLAGEHPDGNRLIDFLNTDSHLFYDRSAYLSHNRIWDQLRSRMNVLLEKAKRYVEKNELDAGLEICLQSAVEEVMNVDPELIGFSVMYLDQLSMTLALVKYIRRKDPSRRRRIILGGASMHALNAEELLIACSEIDGIVLGEGESSFDALLRKEPAARTPGLLYRSASGIQHNPHFPATSVPEPGQADFRALPIKDYFNPSPVFPVVFSRDCPWKKCRFCAHNFSFAGYRKKRVQSFVDELELLNRRFNVS